MQAFPTQSQCRICLPTFQTLLCCFSGYCISYPTPSLAEGQKDQAWLFQSKKIRQWNGPFPVYAYNSPQKELKDQPNTLTF